MADKKQVKVLHVLKSSVYSGAENVVVTIIKQFQDEFEMIYVATMGSVEEKLQMEAVSYRLMPVFDKKHLKQIIDEYQPDIVHAHDFSATVFCAGIRGHFRLISHLHYDPPWSKQWNLKTMIFWCCERKIEYLLGVSEKMFQNMVFTKRYKDKIRILGNPVNIAMIQDLAEETFLRKEISSDILFVGRLVEQKNPQRFLSLVEQLKEKGWNDIHVRLLGAGELLASCNTILVEKNLENNVILEGFVENPFPYMKNTRMLCMTSEWEGFGLVAIEASALGIPVLSTPNSGCLEILGDDAPEICRTDNEFVEKIILLRDDEEVYQQWKERAYIRARHFEDLSQYLAQLRQIYRNEE